MKQPKASGAQGGLQQKIVAIEAPDGFRTLLSSFISSRFARIKLMDEGAFASYSKTKGSNFAEMINAYNKAGNYGGEGIIGCPLDSLYEKIEKKTGISRLNMAKAIRAQNHIDKQDAYRVTAAKDMETAIAGLKPGITSEMFKNYLKKLTLTKEKIWEDSEKAPVEFFLSVSYSGKNEGTVTLYSDRINASLPYGSDFAYEIDSRDYAKECGVKIPARTPSLIITGPAQAILQLREPVAELMLEAMNLVA